MLLACLKRCQKATPRDTPAACSYYCLSDPYVDARLVIVKDCRAKLVAPVVPAGGFFLDVLAEPLRLALPHFVHGVERAGTFRGIDVLQLLLDELCALRAARTLVNMKQPKKLDKNAIKELFKQTKGFAKIFGVQIPIYGLTPSATVVDAVSLCPHIQIRAGRGLLLSISTIFSHCFEDIPKLRIV